MKKYLLIAVSLLIISCDKKSKVEKAVEEIPVEMKVTRFDEAFFEAKPTDLPKLKAEYPFFFDEGTPDNYWLEKMQNPDWRGLYNESQKKFKDFSSQKTEMEELFKHIKYYFPQVIQPHVYTLIAEVDPNSKAIYANDKLLIALELYLGKDNKYYQPFPEYQKVNFTERQMMPDIVQSFAYGVIPQPDNTLLSQMIYHGKEMYLKDILIPEYTDAEKIGYTEDQIKFSQENEQYIWTRFVDEKMIFSSDAKLAGRFITVAPFSKFYLEIDNETPGRIGQWIGWQIVRSFAENNPEIAIKDLLKMDAKELFEKSKYKPKK
jgi:gliding motility-associated lipoprotein GldB